MWVKGNEKQAGTKRVDDRQTVIQADRQRCPHVRMPVIFISVKRVALKRFLGCGQSRLCKLVVFNLFGGAEPQ